MCVCLSLPLLIVWIDVKRSAMIVFHDLRDFLTPITSHYNT
jgi:hypothetical protein